jgi:hypothetical protein
MKQKFGRLALTATPGARNQNTYLHVFGDVYLRAQVALRGDAALVGDAEVSVSGAESPYRLQIADDGEAIDSRLILVKSTLPGPGGTGYGAYAVQLQVDAGATFPTGQVTAEVIFEAPDGFSFSWSNDGGPGWFLILQPD